MSFPISMIPYANMAPYRMLGAPEGCHFVSLVPRESVTALKRNTVLAAAVPVGGLCSLGDLVEPLGPYGIAAKERSMSVLFFSRKPLAQFGPRDRIRLTAESASSVRLLYLLLGNCIGFDRLPRLAAADALDADIDGELVIGNQALVWSWQLSNCPSVLTGPRPTELTQVTDLASEWFAQEKLPFVFARWVVRRDAPEPAKQSLHHWMERFRREEAALVARAIQACERELCAPTAALTRYFEVIRRCLDAEDLNGQARFEALFRRHGRKPLFHDETTGQQGQGRA
jgi:predicted solute-binding protein